MFFVNFSVFFLDAGSAMASSSAPSAVIDFLLFIEVLHVLVFEGFEDSVCCTADDVLSLITQRGVYCREDVLIHFPCLCCARPVSETFYILRRLDGICI